MTKRKTKFKKFEGEERYTSTEIPVSQIEARAQEANTKQDKQNKIIEQSISYLHELNNLDVESFYTIHVNWQCVVTQTDRFDEMNKVKTFYPAQLAIAEFNIKNGLVRRFNKFINPVLPKGYASEARDRKERVHRIPLENEIGESDLSVVYGELKHFLTHGQPNGSIPPLYTRGDNVMNNTSIEGVCSVLKTLYYHVHSGASYAEAALAGDDWEKEFKVYPINKLVYELGRIYQPTKMVDITIADYILEKDPYMYQAGIATKYLEELDSIQNCSLSMVSRWPMVIREFCCPELVKEEKLIIPPAHGTDAPHKPFTANVQPQEQSKPPQDQQEPPEQSQQEQHDKLYPAMKTKEAGPGAGSQATLVHSPSAAPAQQPAHPQASSVSVGSAWAKPLVYQPPSGSYSGATTPGTSNSSAGADNFPPLGGLRISNQNTEAPKKNQGRKKK